MEVPEPDHVEDGMLAMDIRRGILPQEMDEDHTKIGDFDLSWIYEQGGLVWTG